MLEFSPPDDIDLGLVLRFFWLFSSFESALKRSDFLRADHNGNAMPDWSKFGNQISVSLAKISDADFLNASTFLNAHPPQIQTVDGNQLKWVPQQRKVGESESSFALRMTRTVRNNLFHGGKYPGGPVEEVERNKQLIEAAFIVLNACAQLRKDILQGLPYVA